MNLENSHRKNAISGSNIHPVIFRLTNSDDEKRLNTLLVSQNNIKIYDTINNQLQELIKIKNPSYRFSREELENAVNTHLNGIPESAYGVWVYYPWSERLVHILDESEFVEVRTSRNLFKITPEERKVLSEKSVGIVGMSVGQSIAITMVIERILGEIRIADFDLLELTNLNRVRTGLHNLGLGKAIAAAREIAEIDPFIKVKVFDEGITEHNIDDFFSNAGKIDLLVEECDSIDMKVLIRLKAKELGVPVIMETNDRGLIDIERFDLDKNLPILHGLLGDVNPEKVKNLTTVEKVEFVKAALSFEKISERGKLSLAKVGKEITGWPQLGSAVALGSGIATDIARRILLNQFQNSGRYYVDIEEIIS